MAFTSVMQLLQVVETSLVHNNAGTIASGSRALNIDGTGLVVNNSGTIIGTGDQCNGTVYLDATANNATLNNLEGGLIGNGIKNPAHHEVSGIE